MSTYLEEVQAEKKFTGNVVLLIDGVYYAIRQPDSGLVIDSPFDKCVESLVLNPTTVDLRRVTTTISSFSFKIVDRELAISSLILGNAADFIGKEVTVFLGRSFVGMDFAGYYQLPVTRIKKVSYSLNAYTFSSTEDTDRMNRPIYDETAKLGAAILVDTTILQMDRDLSDFPATGLLRIDDEYMSYAAVNTVLNRFTGVIRGELNSTPATHDLAADAYLAEVVSGHPIDILLQILTSGGGGGAYDLLQDGLAISSSLIDLDEIENIRDTLFTDEGFQVVEGVLSNETSALKAIENQILSPLNLRFSYSQNSKLTLAVIDKAIFVEDSGSIDEDSIAKRPTWDVDGNNLTNKIKISWDFDEATQMFLRTQTFTESDSIATYGEQNPLSLEFKWFHDDEGAEEIISEYANALLTRLAFPVPVVGISTHMDKSLRNIGDKAYIESSQIPSSDGSLTFASEMEIVSRAINIQTGDVQFKLAFTSFTSIRSGYISPSDLIDNVVSQKIIDVPAGRGTYYKAGWKMRLWDQVNNTYLADAVNTILSISGDRITFENNWTTILTENYRIRFCDYDDAVDTQKRYAFVSDGSNNFDDGGAPYKVTY